MTGRVIYKDNHSPDSDSKDRYNTCYDTIEYDKYCHERKIKVPSLLSCSDVSAFFSADHIQEPASAKGGDKMITRKILISGDDDLEFVEDDSDYSHKTHILKE